MNAVLFDLDNTLILEDESTFRSLRQAVEHVLPRADPARLVEAVAKTADAVWKDAPIYKIADAFGIWWGEGLWGDFSGDDPATSSVRSYCDGFRFVVWHAALRRVGLEESRASELSAAYITARRSGETIDPDAERVLADLARDHRLALVTNGAGDVQREKLSRTPFAPYFTAVIVSAEVGVGKPDPAIFQRALDALGVKAADATMIGDSLQRDIAGARSAGLRTIWCDRKLWDEQPVEADARIERLSDLRARLDELEQRPASPRATT